MSHENCAHQNSSSSLITHYSFLITPCDSTDLAHLLRLHSQLDDLELIEARGVVRPCSLLSLAQRDLVFELDELAMRGGVAPSAAAEAEEWVVGDADVGLLHESEWC